jgi:hypothetical protein
MGVALYEFGVATSAGVASDASRDGVAAIISNFGIALASTVTGIFLRVFLHQMRVDPAEIENMTRIELSEASKRVQATIEAVALDLGRFHEEMRQRTGDLVMSVASETTKSVGTLNQEVSRSLREMADATGSFQTRTLEQTRDVARLLEETATAARVAVERLKEVEPPPLTLSRRLEKVSKVLESVGEQAERIVQTFGTAGESSSGAARQMSETSVLLLRVSGEIKDVAASIGARLTESTNGITTALNSVGESLARDLTLLSQLEEQTKRIADEGAVARQGSVEVLTALTDIARRIATSLRPD